MDSLEIPPYAPPPPPKRPVRPKITIQIPDTIVPMTARGPSTGTSIYRGPPRFVGIPPASAASHISDPHTNPYLMHLYHNKASEFMFKRFEGFKDFTMNTAKSGLSAGEKSAFWFFNRLKLLSRKWFTHLFLSLCLCLYSLVGATIFVALEGEREKDCLYWVKRRPGMTFTRFFSVLFGSIFYATVVSVPLLCYLALGMTYLSCQVAACLLACT